MNTGDNVLHKPIGKSMDRHEWVDRLGVHGVSVRHPALNGADGRIRGIQSRDEEILRLAGELAAIEAELPVLPDADAARPLAERIRMAILYAQAGNEYGVPTLTAEIERLKMDLGTAHQNGKVDGMYACQDLIVEERARIRRELLEWARQPGLNGIAETTALAAALNRICRECECATKEEEP